jgi:hypothetical protein
VSPRRRWLPVAALSIALLGACQASGGAGQADPAPKSLTGASTGQETAHLATPSPAQTTTPTAMPPYDRAAFTLDGRRWDWTDLDRIPALDTPGPQCDGRVEALKRWSTDRHPTAQCRIPQADVFDFYTGKTANDVDTSTYQADHVLPLALAWRMGAWRWTRERRTAFANWIPNLVMTTAATNGCTRGTGKCDLGPDEWAPLTHARACAYVRTFRATVNAWSGLHTTPAQRAAIRRTLATCTGTENR